MKSAWTFPGCPGPPQWRLDWASVLEAHAWLKGLAEVPQDPVFHAEGDVLIEKLEIPAPDEAHSVEGPSG